MTSSEPLQARYKPLGNSGFRVSVPIVGCMGIGSSKWLPWVLDPEDAAPILKAAYDLGATSWDTANVYSNGESERAIAYALKKYDIYPPLQDPDPDEMLQLHRQTRHEADRFPQLDRPHSLLEPHGPLSRRHL